MEIHIFFVRVYKLPGLMKQSYTESLSNSVYNKKMPSMCDTRVNVYVNVGEYELFPLWET